VNDLQIPQKPSFRGAKSLAGHLEELKIARDPVHHAHSNPDIRDCQRVLDVGCGAGQTLITAYPNTPAVGIDVDFAALRLAKSLTTRAAFACGAAEHLPFADGSFDLVVSRVALPYTHIPHSLAEIRRVLRPGGKLWAVLHPLSIPWKEATSGNFNSYLYFLYVLANGMLFHFSRRQIEFPRHGCESFQTRRGMRTALRAGGFGEIAFPIGPQFVVTATAA